MKKPAILASLGLLVGAIALAQSYPVQLTAGTAGTSGLIGFTLVGIDGASLSVKAAVSAGDPGATIAGKIAAAVANSGWAASVTGSSVSFTHFNGLAWLPVSEIDGLADTADSSLTLATTGPQILIDLSFSPSVSASGYDAHGSPSFLTFSVTGEPSPYTVVLKPGQSPSSIVDGIVWYLQRAGIGLGYTRVSPTEVRINVRLAHSFASLQTSDVALQDGVALSAKSLNAMTGLIDR